MIRRQLSKAFAWMAKTLKGLLDSSQRSINGAGLTFGAIFIAIVVVMVVAMFTKSMADSALAVIIAPELTKLGLGALCVVAVVVLCGLGFKSFKAGFMGAEVEASMVAESAQDAAQALQDLSASVGSDEPS